jgi:hypothetical protein
MSWKTMSLELASSTPVPYPFCETLVNRAWLDIQRSFMWSFLWGDAAIPTIVPISTGTVTLVRGWNQVVGDANAAAAWLATGLVTPLTTQQFRIGQGTIYSITAFDGVNTLTLNQAYVDPTQGSGQGYQIQTVYLNAPTSDFLWWETIKDPISGYTISTTMTREEVDVWDPQRFQSGWPKGVIPYKMNPIPGNFYQYPMYEIWPAPLNGYTYVGTYMRRGLPFTLPTDEVLAPIGEDVVLAQAKYRTYEWCAANPDKCPKVDYRFLMGATTKEKKDLLNGYILMDEEFSHRHIIASLPKDMFDALPWVSQKAMLLAKV